MGRACSTYGEKRNAYMVLAGRPEVKRPLEGPRPRWKNNVRMDLGEIGWGSMDRIHRAEKSCICSYICLLGLLIYHSYIPRKNPCSLVTCDTWIFCFISVHTMDQWRGLCALQFQCHSNAQQREKHSCEQHHSRVICIPEAHLYLEILWQVFMIVLSPSEANAMITTQIRPRPRLSIFPQFIIH
jgi:hypothetical protein